MGENETLGKGWWKSFRVSDGVPLQCSLRDVDRFPAFSAFRQGGLVDGGPRLHRAGSDVWLCIIGYSKEGRENARRWVETKSLCSERVKTDPLLMKRGPTI